MGLLRGEAHAERGRGNGEEGQESAKANRGAGDSGFGCLLGMDFKEETVGADKWHGVEAYPGLTGLASASVGASDTGNDRVVHGGKAYNHEDYH